MATHCPRSEMLPPSTVVNPLTVLKGYQELVDEGLVEKKRGRGMFVTDGARTAAHSRMNVQRFIEKEWPKVLETIDRLGSRRQRVAEWVEIMPESHGGRRQ